MSLVDALFLEPYEYEAWLAYRTDGVKGTGTLNDAFNASPRLDTARLVSLNNSGQVATATSVGHPYQDGDVVTISGDTGAGADRWNGAFIIYDVVDRTSFKYRMTGVPAAATAGTIMAAKVLEFRFDEIMNSLPEKTHVHLGPTPKDKPFLTRGYADAGNGSVGWQTKAGMKISGASMDATVLQLVGAPPGNGHAYAIGHALATVSPAQPNLMDFLEISDPDHRRQRRDPTVHVGGLRGHSRLGQSRPRIPGQGNPLGHQRHHGSVFCHQRTDGGSN